MEYDAKTKTLTIYYSFNEELKELPLDVQIIVFEESSLIHHKEFLFTEQYSKFNKEVDSLPNSTTHLIFGRHFNQRADKLPSSSTHLTFGYNFNQEVNNLPLSLTHLTFGYNFNQEVDNLPPKLTHLTFGSNFN